VTQDKLISVFKSLSTLPSKPRSLPASPPPSSSSSSSPSSPTSSPSSPSSSPLSSNYALEQKEGSFYDHIFVWKLWDWLSDRNLLPAPLKTLGYLQSLLLEVYPSRGIERVILTIVEFKKRGIVLDFKAYSWFLRAMTDIPPSSTEEENLLFLSSLYSFFVFMVENQKVTPDRSTFRLLIKGMSSFTLPPLVLPSSALVAPSPLISVELELEDVLNMMNQLNQGLSGTDYYLLLNLLSKYARAEWAGPTRRVVEMMKVCGRMCNPPLL
jgi:hypothetical protein